MGDLIIRRSWGTWVLIGLAALAFGIIALAWTKPTARVLVFIAGIFFLFYGAVLLIYAFAHMAKKLPFAGPLVWGLLAVAAGVVTFAWPKITAVAILYVLAAWAIAVGLVQLYTAFRMKGSGFARFLFGLAGLVSAIVGLFLIGFPRGGATAIIWLIGAYAIVVGVIYLLAGFELRHLTADEKVQ